jgi:outer membrane protein W
MKKCVLTLFTLCVASVISSHAIKFDVAPYGSYVDAGDLSHSYGGGAKAKLAILDFLAVDARASYLRTDVGKVDMVPLEATAIFQIRLLKETLTPYAGIGVGYYMFASGDVDLKNDVGFYPMLGLEFRPTKSKKFGIFAEVRYLFLESDLDDFSPDIRGSSADMDGVGVNVGVLFRF